MRKIFLASIFGFSLYGCSSGNIPEQDNPLPPVIEQPQPAKFYIPAQTYDTSYKNYKSYSMVDDFIYSEPTIRGYGEFLVKGELSVVSVLMSHKYYSDGAKAGTIAEGEYKSFITINQVNSDNTLTPKQEFRGCMHASKNVVADFNLDGAPDVFIACTGSDFISLSPGEKSNLLLSNGFGSYVVKEIPWVGYYHAATAADINGDGYPDIAVVDTLGPRKVYFLINDKNGSFYRDYDRIAYIGPYLEQHHYYTAELVDVNGDNKVDLLVGGVDNDGYVMGLLAPGSKTYILYNDGTGNFGKSHDIIPPVPFKGIVYDFTFITQNGKRELFIGRMDDYSSPKGAWGGWAVQHLDLDTMESTVIASSETYNMLPNATKPSDWFWLKFYIPKMRDGKWGVEPADLVGTHFFSK